jgi:hypothetical protein
LRASAVVGAPVEAAAEIAATGRFVSGIDCSEHGLTIVLFPKDH